MEPRSQAETGSRKSFWNQENKQKQEADAETPQKHRPGSKLEFFYANHHNVAICCLTLHHSKDHDRILAEFISFNNIPVLGEVLVKIHVIVILRVTAVMKKIKKPRQENTPKYQEDPDPVDCQC